MRRWSPTIRRWQLGQKLRQLRVDAGIKPVAAAKALGVTTSSLSRIETGKQAIREPYVRVIASMGGATDDQLSELLAMCADADQKEWYHDLASKSPDWFRRYLGFESAASEIRTYCAELVDGLLQTEDYARTIAAASTPAGTARGLDGLIALRRGRQARLVGDDPPRLHVVMHQVALTTGVGGAEVMRGQVTRLLELAALPHVTLQVLPFGAGAHPSMTSPFSLLSFDEIPATVYIDVGRGAVYADGPEDVRAYGWRFDRLVELALTAEKTHDLLVRVASDL
jgi:transcriptional regulator with XRE-family HTH domain